MAVQYSLQSRKDNSGKKSTLINSHSADLGMMTAFQLGFRLHAHRKTHTCTVHKPDMWHEHSDTTVGWLPRWAAQYSFHCVVCVRVCVNGWTHVCCVIVGLPTYSSRIVSAAEAAWGVLTFCKQKNTTLPLFHTPPHTHVHIHFYKHISTFFSLSLSVSHLFSHIPGKHMWPVPAKNRLESMEWEKRDLRCSRKTKLNYGLLKQRNRKS